MGEAAQKDYITNAVFCIFGPGYRFPMRMLKKPSLDFFSHGPAEVNS